MSFLHYWVASFGRLSFKVSAGNGICNTSPDAILWLNRLQSLVEGTDLSDLKGLACAEVHIPGC